MRLGHARAIVSGHTDHLPAHSVHPPGVLVLRRHWNPDDEWWEIRRADPQVNFSHALLAEVADKYSADLNGRRRLGTDYPCMTLTPVYGHTFGECRLDGRCFNNWLLHIEGRDEKAIYRIGEYRASRDEWVARFPD